MAKKIINVVVCIYFIGCLASIGFAETVYLKNGNKIEGKIVEKTHDRIKIEVSGIGLTYYMDEIEKIEGETGTLKVPETPEKGIVPPSNTGISGSSASYPTPTKVIPEINYGFAPTGAVRKDDLVMELVEVSGARQNMDNIFGSMLSNASLEEIEKMRALFNFDELVQQLIPVYGRHFTKGELQELIAFYKSSIGRKLLKITPIIMEESMETTLKYFQNRVQQLQAQ